MHERQKDTKIIWIGLFLIKNEMVKSLRFCDIGKQ